MASFDDYDLSQLFAEISRGDTRAFTIVFDKYYSRIYSTALQYCKIKSHASDITQQVFTLLWEKRAALPEIANAEGWLWTVTKFQTLKLMRAESVRNSYVQSVKEIFQSEMDTPFDKLIIRQRSERITQIINALPPRQQEVYKLSRHQGATYADIAKQLGIGVETVKEHMSKALKVIREMMLNYRDELIILIVFGAGKIFF